MIAPALSKPIPWQAAAVAIIAALAVWGCTTIQQAMPSHRAAQRRAQQLQELQLKVMRFSDEYTGRVVEAITQFQAAATQPEERLVAQNWKLQQATAAYTIASGTDPITNALDMVVLATLSHLVVDDLWVAELYGERASALQMAHRELEARAWEVLTGFLTEAQLAELREIITRWRQEHPDVRAVAYIHFIDFARSAGALGEKPASGGLFAMLGLDPLAQLEPAVREITQTRDLAERVIFYMQRAPGLLDMQIERLTYEMASMPQTRTLLAAADRASLVGSAADQLVGILPDVLAQEREALVSQLMRGLGEQEAALGTLSQEVRATLQAGTETVDALGSTLKTVDRISARYPPKPASLETAAPARPFDIREYTELARELAVTTRELSELIGRADAAVPAANRLTQDATSGVQQIVDHLYRRLLLLVLITIGASLLAALAYRLVVARLMQPR